MHSRFLTILIFLFIHIICLKGSVESQGRRIFLIEAINQENIDIVTWLINEEADLNIRDGDQRTPLMHAVSKENGLDIVKKLVDKCANIFLSDKNGTTALHLAAMAGRVDIIEYFQTQDIFLGVKDKQEKSSLLLAAEFGQTNTLSYLISQGEDPYSNDIEGLTPVHLAAKNGHVNVLEELNNRSINLDIKTKGEVTPLILAALNNHTDAGTYLVGRGANINTLSLPYGSPMHSASYSGNFDLVKLFIENNATANLNSFGQSPIYVASENGHLNIVKYLMQQNADLHNIDKEGNHLLHSAAASGNVELLKFLLSQQLSPVIKNNKGESPLLVAAEKGHLNVVKHLVNIGCDVNSVNNFSFSVMHAASVSGNLYLCKYLSDNGAAVNLKDFYGMTPLHYASKHGKLSVLIFIINRMLTEQREIDPLKNHININRTLNSCISCYKRVVNIKDNQGRTPIFIAAENGHENVIKFLIEHGGNFSLSNNSRISPFHVAASKGHVNCLKILAFYIADLDIKYLGKTALILSAEFGQLDSVIFLIDAGANPLAGNNGMTAMHVASSNGNFPIVKYLASFRDLINAEDNSNRTPAWYASFGGHIQCLSYLIKQDAKIKFQTLESSIEGEQLKSLEFLLKNGANIEGTNSKGLSLLELACERGNISFVELLMDNDPDFLINSPNSLNGLRSAVYKKKYDIVNLFISRGADICLIKDIIDINLINRFPVLDLNLLKIFLNNGCTEVEKTAIKVAAKNDMPDVLQFLLNRGQNINQTFEEDGKTLLHLAVESTLGTVSPTIVLLLKLKPNLNINDYVWGTPLHYAAQKDNTEVLEALINAGANVNQNNFDRNSPLEIARHFNKIKAEKCLLAFGAIELSTTTPKMYYDDIMTSYDSNESQDLMNSDDRRILWG